MSAPSMAIDRLHVIGSTCRFAGVTPAPKPHSERPGFDRRDRSCHGYRLTTDAARLLVGAAVVTFSLRYVRASCMLSLSSCPDHVSKQSEAPWHVSSDAHSSCVPSATVCLLVGAHLDKCRVPSPAASIGSSPSHLGGCLGSAERLGGREAWRFQGGDAVRVPRLSLWRRFVACLEHARGIAQRCPMAVSGPLRPHLCVYCWAC